MRYCRPGRLHLLCAGPGPHPAPPPRYLRTRQHPVGRSPRRTAHRSRLGPPARHAVRGAGARPRPGHRRRPARRQPGHRLAAHRRRVPRQHRPAHRTRDGRDEIVVTPLDAETEAASLVALRGEVERLLPEVEIADLPLEVHGWTGFLDEYTHISDTGTREARLPESLSALLVSESCNVGLTPVVDENYPPLSRERLNWVGHNYLRSATDAAANVRLVDYHTAAAGPGLGRRGDGLRGRDALRHPRVHHQRRLQPALLRPATRLHAVLVDGRHLHRVRAQTDPRHPARQPARPRRAAGQPDRHPAREGLHRHARIRPRPGLPADHPPPARPR
jgi:Tn3 transposase DDE domain